MSGQTGGIEQPSYPESEILDYVERKGPITSRQIIEECGIWSPDEVYQALVNLQDEGFVTGERGDIERHGTTRQVWYVEPDTGQEGER